MYTHLPKNSHRYVSCRVKLQSIMLQHVKTLWNIMEFIPDQHTTGTQQTGDRVRGSPLKSAGAPAEGAHVTHNTPAPVGN